MFTKKCAIFYKTQFLTLRGEEHMMVSDIFSKRALVRAACQGEVVYALWDGGRLTAYHGSPLAGGAPGGRELDPQKVQLLAPCQPGKVVAIGLNYHLHAKEMNMEPPAEPLLFLKPPTSVIGPRAAIIKPQISKRVDFEGELGVVIGKSCFAVSVDRALDYVLGYTCLNDVTARDLQAQDIQFTRSKSFDSFCPLGPAIALDVNPSRLGLQTLVNGQVKQSGNTSDMIFDIAFIVSYISRVMTLHPGDVIATGTPPGVGALRVGDVVVVEVEGIGRLENKLAQ
jgi:2-keto-4-pentenoate hydratase/2-oxohepta-3-ene-1,7-dioic acid hydratase in catechol pathway